MAGNQKRKPSLGETLGMFAASLLTIVHALWDIITTFKDVQAAGWSLKRMLIVSILRNRTNIVTRPSHLTTQETTGEIIGKACQKRNIAVSSTVFQCGKYPDATLHEIKLEGATQDVLVYFHGGGYKNTIYGEGHVPVVLELARASGASRVFFLEYSLTPGAKYPAQLVQAARAMQILLGDKALRPDQIILGGDSAGGNLVLGLLAHIKTPHKSVPAISEFSAKTKFKAVMLISPWVTCPTSAVSFVENAKRDYISVPLVNMYLDIWSPSDDVWADPLRVGADFWKTVPTAKMIITVGGFECLRDDVIAQARLFGPAMGERLKFVVAPGEVHVQSVFDIAASLGHSKSYIALIEWCRAL
ncbi:hypothetical protein VTL71DRAFT_2455 [Oculimacula yallundae]|uniref:Alpha/beta hydrolase fold-3 domain-containing protein n=1 Tax=Oculimacula yallundae TaxID=86028 RepID=A0ABR4C8X5_9HELO